MDGKGEDYELAKAVDGIDLIIPGDTPGFRLPPSPGRGCQRPGRW